MTIAKLSMNFRCLHAGRKRFEIIQFLCKVLKIKNKKKFKLKFYKLYIYKVDIIKK